MTNKNWWVLIIVYHGPYQGNYNFSSEYDLQMDGMSLFAANDFLVNEIFFDDLIIRSHEINEGISKINYYVSFSYVYDGTTYFGHIFLQKTNLAYDDLSLDALINSVVEAYEKL